MEIVRERQLNLERKRDPMSTGGLSQLRLARMHDAMTRHVANGRLPGLVTLVSRRGETHVDAIGMKAFGGREPMRRDTIMIQRVWDSPVAPAVNRDFRTAAYQAIDD